MTTTPSRRPKSILQLIREGQGKSRQKCADALRVDVDTWKRWELGYQPPTAINLLRIAAYLGVTAESLMPITERSPDRPTRRSSKPALTAGGGPV
jgi:transcriptional regulator with XRE-family HTH domain